MATLSKRTKILIAAGVVGGLFVLGSLLPDKAPEPGKAPLGARVFIKVVQQEYPTMVGAEAVNLGGAACDVLDQGGSLMDAMREVARLDGRTDRARYVTEAAVTILCSEHERVRR